MKYRLVNGAVHAYESDGSQDHLIPADAEPISEADAIAIATPPVAPPKRVTMRQARLALHAAGLLHLVDAAIDNLEEPHKTAARIEWEYSQEVHRDKQLVVMLAPALGLSETDLDNLFIAAAQL